jgi:hypothetical protein
MTNIDLVAEELNTSATKDDFIVVDLYWPAISVNRYYHGAAPWASIPDVEDHLVHRMDQVRDKMIHQPVTPVMERVAQTLRSGHRVYLVGALEFIPVDLLQRGWKPVALPPPPLPETGWNDAPYLSIWSRQVAYALETTATSLKQVPVPVDGPVNGFENEPLFVAEGSRQ